MRTSKRTTRCQFESLESRRLLSALTVSIAADSGAGSLRAQIAAAQSGDTINFAPGLAGQTITLSSGEIAFAKSLTIQGLGANQLTISGAFRNLAPGQVFGITGSTNEVAIRDLTITGAWGGAIDNAAVLTISGCTLSDNSSVYYYPYNWNGGPGGAIYNTGTLMLSNSIVSGNDAADGPGGHGGAGGAIFNAGTLTVSGSSFFGNSAGHPSQGGGGGGAIYNYGGTATISGSTFASNRAYVGGGAISINGGALTVSNCTIVDNSAFERTYYVYDDEGNVIANVGGDAGGGGLSVGGGGTLSIDHSTLVGNRASGGAGDPGYEGRGRGGALDGSAIHLYNTIVAGNTADDQGPDLNGAVISLGHNLIGNPSAATGFVATDLLNVNPQLGPLQDNGGPTQTMALLAGSPAINAGNNTSAPAYDQRGGGFPRILDDTIDIGAFETGNSADYTALSVSDVTVTEGNTGTVNAVLTVTLATALTSAATVNFATSDGTATVAGDDYLAASGSLTFSPGETSRAITVTLKGDRSAEPNEQFVVNFIGAPNSHVSSGQGAVTITDDEPRISIADASVTEANSGTTPINFTVTLAAPYDVATSVNFSTASGTPGVGGFGGAVSGRDFDAHSGTLTFLAGQTSKTLSVAVRGDVIDESDEAFSVALSGSTNGLISRGTATGVIIDEDAPPAIIISDVSRAEGNSGTTSFTFTIALLNPSEKYVVVKYATANGSATSSTAGGKQDYLPDAYDYLQLNAQQGATVTVQVFGDTRSESDETFFINLSNPVNATIADAQGTGTILNDESRGKTWVGPASAGSWSTAGNWSPSGVPVADSLVAISAASVTLPSTATVGELWLASGATLTLAAGGDRVLRTDGLYADVDAELNLNDNDMILDYSAISPVGVWTGSAYDGVSGMIKTGRITSSLASGQLKTLGVAEAREALGISGAQTASFAGQAVDSTSVLVKFTWGGDATLDGIINIDDYGRIDANVAVPGAAGWYNGDFNYDGKINIDDYGIIDGNINQQSGIL